jgi:hypothetical protein
MHSNDSEDKDLPLLILRAESMTCLSYEVRHIDNRQRVGTFEDKNSAYWNGGDSLFCSQDGKRAAQTAQIEVCLGHSGRVPEIVRQFDTWVVSK